MLLNDSILTCAGFLLGESRKEVTQKKRSKKRETIAKRSMRQFEKMLRSGVVDARPKGASAPWMSNN
jgi:hypothetical protein